MNNYMAVNKQRNKLNTNKEHNHNSGESKYIYIYTTHIYHNVVS